jgi:hypothetical protein
MVSPSPFRSSSGSPPTEFHSADQSYQHPQKVKVTTTTPQLHQNHPQSTKNVTITFNTTSPKAPPHTITNPPPTPTIHPNTFNPRQKTTTPTPETQRRGLISSLPKGHRTRRAEDRKLKYSQSGFQLNQVVHFSRWKIHRRAGLCWIAWN